MDDKNIIKFNSLQQAIKTLIAEEWIAGQLYLLWATGCNDSNSTCDMLFDLFKDEIEDHYINLCDKAWMFELKLPRNVDEYLKIAGKPMQKAWEDSQKIGKPVEFYLENAILGEVAAIMTYEAVLNQFPTELNELIELKQVILNNYYEEQEHLGKLQFTLNQFKTYTGMGMRDNLQ